MEKTLDELLEFLLEEIAIGGRNGVSFSDIASFCGNFYTGASKLTSKDDGSAFEAAESKSQSIDQPFLSSVWRWLGRHPDISIGKNKKYNRATKEEIIHYFAKYGIPGSNVTPTVDNSQSQIPVDEQCPRVYLDQNRLYWAICGHAPDTSKVSSLEFTLLTHIAATRQNGILQGDLVRASGQDKRSVPKRTDALCKKGYILKQDVYVKGTKTSRLLMHRFGSGHLEARTRSAMRHSLNDEIDQDDDASASFSRNGVAAPLSEEQLSSFVDDPQDSSGRDLVPMWNPDRIWANALLDATRKAGLEGLSNLDARNAITGPFVRRPIESMLSRLSLRAFTPQSLQTEHLTIVRTVSKRDGTIQYIHYTFAAFQNLVKNGQLDWSAVHNVGSISNSQRLKILQDPSTVPDENSINEHHFGFSNQTPPVLQFRNGEVSQDSILRMINPVDIAPRIGEPVLEEDENGEYRIGEYQPKSGKSRNTRQTKLSLQDEDRVDELAASGDKPKGRPRKFMRGTEKFWQVQFSISRLRAESADRPRSGKARTTTDAAGQIVFNRRPQNFDETLVRAIDAGLPIPALPEDIGQSWIDKTNHVLSRVTPGLYITPVGTHLRRPKNKSQIMILKTSRIQTVDFTDRDIVAPYRFLSSSYAHSYHYRRYYSQNKAKLFNGIVQRKWLHIEDQRHDSTSDKAAKGPELGIFYEAVQTTTGNELPPDPSGFHEHATIEGNTDSDQDGASTQQSPMSLRKNTILRGLALDEQENPKRPLSNSKASELSHQFPTTPKRPARKRKLTEKASDLLETTPKFSVDNALQTPESSTVPPIDFEESINIDSDMTTKANIGHSGLVSSGESFTDNIQVMNHANHLGLADAERAFDVPQETEETYQQSMLDEGESRSFPVTISPRSNETPLADVSAPIRAVEQESSPVIQSPSKSVPKKANTRRRTASSRDTNALCRSIIIELISDCSGAAPNDASTIRRVMANRWQSAGECDRPLLKAVKAAIKSLVENGKLKNMMFTFRGKGGVMVKRSILVVPSTASSQDIVDKLKQKIIDADPAEHIPDEWELETSKAPPKSLKRRLSQTVDSPAGPSPYPGVTLSGSDPERIVDIDSLPAVAFLTLKIPSLGVLACVQKWEQAKQLQSLYLTTQHNAVSDEPSAFAESSGRRRSARARRETSRFEPNANKINWAKPDLHLQPASLNDILNEQRKRGVLALDAQGQDEFTKFCQEIDAVQSWEQRGLQASNANQGPVFINHHVQLENRHCGTLHYSYLIGFDSHRNEIESEYPPALSSAHQTASGEHPSGMEVEYSANATSASTPIPVTDQGHASKRKKRQRLADEEEKEFVPPHKRAKRGLKSTSRRSSERTYHLSPDTGSIMDTSRPGRHFPVKRQRGLQYLRNMDEEEIYRIAVGVVCICTLTGGLEKFIDWPLVARLFPDKDEQYVKDRWQTMRNRYRREIHALTIDLQSKYLTALEKDEVPTVDFQDFTATDWQGILQWAMSNLTTARTAGLGAMPDTREELLETYDFSFNDSKGIRSLYAYNTAISQPQKEGEVSSVVFATSHQSAPSKLEEHRAILPLPKVEEELSDSSFARARSWVLATVLTAEASFNPPAAQKKLLMLADTAEDCETLIEKALESLQREKTISRIRDKRGGIRISQKEIAGLRTWEVSNKFYEQFEWRRMITTNMLKSAASYKLDFLDQIFARGEKLTFDKQALIEDGEMVALLNLLSMGMIKIRAAGDVPRSRYGLEWQKVRYETRLVDKKALAFSVEFEISQPDYTFGDPTRVDADNVPVPRGEMDDLRGLIPAWFDIHGDFQPQLWEMFLGAIIGLISQRPGIDATELARTLAWALSEWEIHLLVLWLQHAGFAEATQSDQGWQTTPWWWMCLANRDWDASADP